MLCLHDEGHRVRLETIYVPIKTVTYKKTARGEQKRELNHYSEIFTLVSMGINKNQENLLLHELYCDKIGF